MPLDASTRRELKARAHALSAIVQTGERGLTEAVIAEVDQAIEHHELIKVRMAGIERDVRAQMATQLAEAVKADIVGQIGGVVILFRPTRKKKKAAASRSSASNRPGRR